MLTTGKGTHYCKHCGFDMRAKEERDCAACDGDLCEPRKRTNSIGPVTEEREATTRRNTIVMSNGPFAVLVADPPWSFGDKLPGAGRGAEKHYAVLDQAGIEAFPLPPLAQDALLFMWRVSSQPEEACRVMRAWGFVPKSEIVWRKLTPGGKPHFGMGRYVRLSHEVCMIGTRGRGLTLIQDRAIRSVFEAPTGRHSEKPEVFFDIVEKLAKGPYAELFARRHRAGWACFGNELSMTGGQK